MQFVETFVTEANQCYYERWTVYTKQNADFFA